MKLKERNSSQKCQLCIVGNLGKTRLSARLNLGTIKG